MNKFLLHTTAVILLVALSCTRKPDDAGVVYEYVEKKAELSAELQEQIGSWAEEGTSCYGILALIDGEGVMQEGAVIHAKIIRFRGDSVKMKSLENIKLREVEGCDQMGIKKGETWWETEGDIYQTEEEAAEKLTAALEKLNL